MLVEFRLANFRSFKDEAVLSFLIEGGKDKSHPHSLIDVNGQKALRTMALYGANASGKSNLIEGLRTMRRLVVHSASEWNKGEPLPGVVPFRLNPESTQAPCSFEVVVVRGEQRYQYGFETTSKRVVAEWLDWRETPTAKAVRLFVRDASRTGGKAQWSFDKRLERWEELFRKTERDNCLALSRGAELEVDFLTDLYLWFRQELWIFDLSKAPGLLLEPTAESFAENVKVAFRLRELLADADFGIQDVAIEPCTLTAEQLPSDLPDAIKEVILRNPKNHYRIKTVHPTDDGRGTVEFDLERDESNGTKRFFGMAGPFLDALSQGATIAVDEFECSMHPHLTRKWVEMFQNPKTNPGNAQLLFATHDVTLMVPDLFRRDQLWLVEKKHNGASELYSLYDFQDRPRHTERFDKNYLAGRYGGVPRFGESFEDLDTE